MKPKPPLYQALYQLISLSLFKDKRHKITLLWMVYGLIVIKDINLPEWIPFVQSRAKQAQRGAFHESRLKCWQVGFLVISSQNYLEIVGK